MLSRLILLASLLVVATGAPQAQDKGGLSAPDFPIVKPGLWEDAIRASDGSTQRVRSCVADDRAATEAGLARMPHGCSATSKTHTGTIFNIDMSCNWNHVTRTAHMRVSMPDDEHVHSVITMQTASAPVRMTIESHFVGSDCGNVVPGKGQMMH